MLAAPILATLLVFQAPARAFESKEGGFRVAMPAAPVEEAQQIPSSIGPIDAHFFTATKGKVNLIASYSDYPDDVGRADPDQILEGAAKGSVGAVKGAKLLRKADRKLGRLPGKEVEFSFPGPKGAESLGRTQLYLSGTRMYSLLAIGPKADVPGVADPFFRSFVVTEPSSRPAARPAMPRGNPGPADRPGPAATAVGKAKTYASAPGGFRVTLPADPREQTIKQDSPIGAVETHVYAVAQEGTNYVVTYTRLPAQAAKTPAGATLDDLVEGTVTTIKGALISKRAIRLGPHEGREFEFTGKGADGKVLFGRSRAFVANGIIYQLLSSGAKEKVNGPEIDLFFQSFALTAPRPAAAPRP